MKMSEFTTKSFLGNAGAAENSYILINYEDNTTQRPVTYKASLQEIGKAIANDQKLYKKTQNGAITTNVSQGAYVNTAAENFASVGYVNTKTNGIITTSNISSFTNGFASTGYVTSAVNTATNGLASTGYVDAAVENAGGATGGDGDAPVFVDGSGGNLRWYNPYNPSDSNPYPAIATNGYSLLVYDTNNDAIGYFPAVSSSEPVPIEIGGGGTDLHGYLYAQESLPGSGHQLYFQEEGNNAPTLVTPAMIGAVPNSMLTELGSTINALPSNGDVVGLIYSEYDNDGVARYSNGLLRYHAGTGSIGKVTVDMISGAASIGALAAKASTGAVTAAVNGLASTGYVTNAISGLASTGAVTAWGLTKLYDSSLMAYDSDHTLAQYVTASMISGAASTGYVTEAVNGLIENIKASSGLGASIRTIMTGIFERGIENLELLSEDDVTDVIDTATNNLTSYNYVDNSISNAIYGLASTGYVTDAISGLASTGDLYSVPVQYSTNIFTVNGDHYAMVQESEYTKLLLLGESDNKPCIRDQEGVFHGFFSAT